MIRTITNADIIRGFSELILNHLEQAARERHHPMHTADEMGDYIKNNLNMAAEFRRLRENFENTSTGVLL